jgi:hypothetical protein
VRVHGLAPHFANSPRPGILLGYARLGDAEIREGIRRLATVIPVNPPGGALRRHISTESPAKVLG